MTQHQRPHAPTRPLPLTLSDEGALTLGELIGEITDLWKQTKPRGVRTQAEACFAKYPKVREDREQARSLRAELRLLLGLDAPTEPDASGAAPFAILDLSPRTRSDAADEVQVDAPTPDAAHPTDEEGDEPEGDQEGEADPGDAAAPPEEPTAPTVTPPVNAPQTDPRWPDGTLGTGFLSALAATLASGDSVQFNFTRAGGQLHVTVIPKRVLGEPGSTAQPLAVSGTPAELDADLRTALGLYGAARQTARDAANELLRRTYEAAEKAKAAKTTASTSKPSSAQTAEQTRVKHQASVTVRAPEGAVITLTDAKGGTQMLQAGVGVKLDAQRVMVKVELNGHEPFTSVLTLKPREEKVVPATLKPLDQGGLF